MAKFIKALAPVSFDLIGFRVDVPVVAMLSIFLSIKLLFFVPTLADRATEKATV